MNDKNENLLAENPENISILVLDDEQEIVDTIIDILAGEGYTMDGITDPQIALKSIKKGAYDIIITDLVMPGYTGIDVANFVKENSLDVSVIVITGYATVESAIQAVQLGVYDYIKKPFNHHEILLIVRRAVERLVLQRRNESLYKKNKRMIKDITLMCEISSILYQVHDTKSASKMILDTIDEYFKVRRTAVAVRSEGSDKFRIVNARSIPQSFVEDFSFRVGKKINDIIISDSDVTHIPQIDSEIKSDGKKMLSQDLTQLLMVPVNFHNEVAGFVLLFFTAEDPFLSPDDMKLLKILGIQISPVMHAFQCGFKEEYDPEEKTDQIVRNYLFESQTMLRPISFALFRVTVLESFDNQFQLSDLVNIYRSKFNSSFNSEDTLMWISLDTLLVVMPGYDYFQAEARCTEAKEKIESIYNRDAEQNTFSVAYSCLGYPQAGEDISDVNRELWSKLLYEYANFAALEKSNRS